MAVRQSVKDRLVALDTVFLEGFIRRTYYGQHLPNLSTLKRLREGGAYSWIEPHEFLAIGHRLGPRLHGGANTLRTMREGLRMGFRVFEVDLVLTVDGHLLCLPEGSGKNFDQITYSSYLAIVAKTRTDPCRFTDLVALARRRSDVQFILDVKNRFEMAYRIAQKEIADPLLGRSFIPQVYDFEQVEMFRQSPFFAGEIFAAYRSVLTTQQILEMARHSGIQAVSVPLKRFNELQGHVPRDLYIMPHPVNDPFLALRLRALGARGIYTSYLTPRTVPELFHTRNDG